MKSQISNLRNNEVYYKILREHITCFQREVSDRIYYEYGIRKKSSQVKRDLESDNNIIPAPPFELRSEVNNGVKSFRFYYLKGSRISRVKQVINQKLNYYTQHLRQRQSVEYTNLDMIIANLRQKGFKNIKTHKESHNGVSIDKKDADVFALSPDERYYLHIESMNRKSFISSKDIQKVIDTRNSIIANWNLDKPVYSAIVCSFIYRSAIELSYMCDIPVVYTKKVYVPNTPFYTEFPILTGGKYYTSISGEETRLLGERIDKHILQYIENTGKIKIEDNIVTRR